ncbi:MAG TPA: cysteine rich repeat-containing protein [Bdellovibrionota bacterium]|nr:cysteine rich repeat-containing protein [Bdellovibrionota bacterium]
MKLFLLTVSFLCAAAVFAEETPSQSPPAGEDTSSQHEQAMMKQGPCSSDLKQYCKDVTPGQGRIAACLKANGDKLSGGCRLHLEAMKGSAQAARR